MTYVPMVFTTVKRVPVDETRKRNCKGHRKIYSWSTLTGTAGGNTLSSEVGDRALVARNKRGGARKLEGQVWRARDEENGHRAGALEILNLYSVQVLIATSERECTRFTKSRVPKTKPCGWQNCPGAP